MESERRSMLMFRPSSSTCRFSSRVPNSVSMLGLISILFFIQVYTIAGYPRAQKRRLQSRSLDVTSEVEEQPASCRLSSDFTSPHRGGDIKLLLKRTPGREASQPVETHS